MNLPTTKIITSTDSNTRCAYVCVVMTLCNAIWSTHKSYVTVTHTGDSWAHSKFCRKIITTTTSYNSNTNTVDQRPTVWKAEWKAKAKSNSNRTSTKEKHNRKPINSFARITQLYKSDIAKRIQIAIKRNTPIYNTEPTVCLARNNSKKSHRWTKYQPQYKLYCEFMCQKNSKK